MLTDMRLGVRGLAKSPIVVLTAVATLAVGIASTTAVFSIVNAAMLRPLNYGHPERLVLVWMARGERHIPGNPPADVYLRWQARARSFENLAAVADTSFDLDGNPPVRIGAVEATANFFPAVEVQPIMGRIFTEEEARSGARVLVLSHSLWKNHFASNQAIIGKTVRLSGAPWTVIGVMPASFSFARHHDLWIPMDLTADRLKARGLLMPIARLRTDVSIAQANAEMDAIQQQVIQELPDVAASTFNSARVMPVRDILLGGKTERMMLVLFGAVGFVLLIACVNIANLLLARGASRRKEIAVRFSLGATRVRIIRQLLSEAAVLAIVGASAGLTLAFWSVRYLSTLPFLQAPGMSPASIDLTVLAFVAAVTVLTVLVSGILTAWQTSHVSPIETLESTSATLASAHSHRVRNALVVAEVALSVALLVSAGLLMRRFVDLVRVNPGVDASGVLTMDITRTRDKSSEAVRGFYYQALERVGTLPGVEAAALSTTLPMVGWKYGISFRRPDQPKETILRQGGMLNVVSAEYFRTLRLPILRGRTFTAQDNAASLPVVIVNRQFAQRHFKNEDPVGKTLITAAPFDNQLEVARQVVGICGDVLDSGIENPIIDDVYLPLDQYLAPSQYLSVRSRNDPTALTNSIRAAVANVDKDQPLEDLATMQQRIDDSLQWSRFAMTLLGGFAAVSLLLAAIGIYGVVTYATTQRTAEFGLRMALGARPRTLLAMVLTSGIKLVVAGSCIGIAAALVIARLLSSSVTGINPRNPMVFMATLVVIVSAALLAAWIPARRAATLDPIVALRHD